MIVRRNELGVRQEFQTSIIEYTSYIRAEPLHLSVCLKILQTMNKRSPLTLILKYHIFTTIKHEILI